MVVADGHRLITRYRGAGFVAPAAHALRDDAGPLPRLLRFAVVHVPGVELALRGVDYFISDPLHHYMDTGMLAGIKARAEGRCRNADDAHPHPTAVALVASTD